MPMNDIDPATPTGADPVSEGDNQFNQLKLNVVDSWPVMSDNAPATATQFTTNVTGLQLEQIADGVITEDWDFTARLDLNGGALLANETWLASLNLADDAAINLIRATTADNIEVGNGVAIMRLDTPQVNCDGNVSALAGTVTGANVVATNVVNALTVTATGTVSGATVDATGTLTHTGTLLGVYNTTPIAQPTTASPDSAVFYPGTGSNITSNSTFDSYTIRQVVRALRDLGLLA